MKDVRVPAGGVVLLATLLNVLCPSFVMGQVHEMRGDTVRVRLSSDQSIEGVVLSWSSSLLELQEGAGSVIELDWREVREVARLRRRRNTWQGLWIGALAGGVLAGTHAGVTWEPCTALCFGPDDRGGTIVLASLIGGAAGGLVGLAIGALIKSSSWEPLVIPSVSGSRSSDPGVAVLVGMRWSGP